MILPAASPPISPRHGQELPGQADPLQDLPRGQAAPEPEESRRCLATGDPDGQALPPAPAARPSSSPSMSRPCSGVMGEGTGQPCSRLHSVPGSAFHDLQGGSGTEGSTSESHGADEGVCGVLEQEGAEGGVGISRGMPPQALDGVKSSCEEAKVKASVSRYAPRWAGHMRVDKHSGWHEDWGKSTRRIVTVR